MPNLTLYVRTNCGYSTEAIEAMKALGLTWTEKNVNDPGITEELISRGGKKQEPYLVDEKNQVEMYEAPDIIKYLEKTYGHGKKLEIVETKGGVCEL